MPACSPPIMIVPEGSWRGLDPAGGGDPLVEPAEIGEARQEADHVDAVDCRRMDLDHLGRRHAVGFRHVLEVAPEFAAIDHRHAPAPADGLARRQILRLLVHEPDQGLVIGLNRVELNGQRAIGRYRLEQAGRCAGPDDVVEREDHAVDVRIDPVAELDCQGAVAAGKDLRCRHDEPVGMLETASDPQNLTLPEIRQRASRIAPCMKSR